MVFSDKRKIYKKLEKLCENYDTLYANYSVYNTAKMLKFQQHVKARLLTQKNVFNLYMHEYQAYDLLKKYQVPLVPVSIIPYRATEPARHKML